MDQLVQQLINALSLGGIYAMLALGLAIVFSIVRLINFAHGEIMTFGGYGIFLSMVFGFPPSPITYPRFRAYNVAPEHSSDYRDLEITLKDGELHLGDGCARFTAHRFGDSEPFTTEYAVLYRW